MATRSASWRGWGLSISAPDGLSSRRGRRTVQHGGLRFMDPPPEPRLRDRDVAAATAFIQAASDKGEEHAAAQGWSGDEAVSQTMRSVSWYHTIELPGGVVTPGQFDHRSLVPRYGLPADLHGKRALDVATFDGFWAFEMERRGASVTAIDLEDPREWDFPALARPVIDGAPDLPPIGQGFAIAHQALGSSVERVVRSVYSLDEQSTGKYDFVHCGDLLLHLRDPLTALEHIRSVTDGTFLLSDVVDIDAPSGRFGPSVQYLGGWQDIVWWVPSIDTLGQMLIDAGFRDVKVNAVYQLAKTYDEAGFWRASLTATT